VQAAINAARADLPTSLRTNPTYRKINPADAPIMVLTLTSTTRTPGQIYDVASNVLQQRLSQLDGIGKSTSAAARFAGVRVELNPARCSNTASGLRTCARRWLPPTPTARRARSRTIHGTSRSTPTIRRRKPPTHTALVVAYRNNAAVRSPTSRSRGFGRGLAQRRPRRGTASRRSRFSSVEPGANIIDSGRRREGGTAASPSGVARRYRSHVVVDRSITIRGSLTTPNAHLGHRSRAGHLIVVVCSCAIFARSSIIPSRRRAGVDHRLVRRDVSAWLQPRTICR
jgi:multidrug efflux pump